jgi:hypothetical protein
VGPAHRFNVAFNRRCSSFQRRTGGRCPPLNKRTNKMFIRFVSNETDEHSHVSAGLFSAAFKLLDETVLSDHEYAAVADLMGWFRLNLRGPFAYRLRSRWRAPRSICWFRCTAHEHLAGARELATILEDRQVFIRTIKCHTTRYVLKTKPRFSRNHSPI